MIPLAIVQAAISWSSDVHADAQGGSEGCHWVKAAIESEHELIQIGRQVLLTHTVVSSQEPRFQVGENQVNHGQCLLRLFHIAIKHNRFMAISEFRQVAVARPTVGRDTAMRQDIFRDERFQRFSGSIIQSQQPKATSVHASTTALVRLFSGLNRANDVGLVMNAAPLTSRLAADQSLIHLDRPIPADPVSVQYCSDKPS